MTEGARSISCRAQQDLLQVAAAESQNLGRGKGKGWGFDFDLTIWLRWVESIGSDPKTSQLIGPAWSSEATWLAGESGEALRERCTLTCHPKEPCHDLTKDCQGLIPNVTVTLTLTLTRAIKPLKQSLTSPARVHINTETKTKTKTSSLLLRAAVLLHDAHGTISTTLFEPSPLISPSSSDPIVEREKSSLLS